MEKARMYVFIIIKAICFYAKKHMYITGALAAVTIRSLWGAVSTQNTFWLVCPIATVLIIFIPRYLYRKLDEFASPGVQGKHARQKVETKKELEKYIEESAKEYSK